MKLSLTGKIVSVGRGCSDGTGRAEIVLREGNEDAEDMLLEFDLGQKDAAQLAQYLFGDVRVCIEVVPKPKIVE